jgi:hypothetical protein
MRTRKAFFAATETYERITVTCRSARRRFDECGACGKVVQWLSVVETSIKGISFSSIAEKIGNGELDFRFSAEGDLLICSESVSRITNSNRERIK